MKNEKNGVEVKSEAKIKLMNAMVSPTLNPSFNEALQELFSKNFYGKTLYWVIRVIKVLFTRMNEIEIERNKLLEKYGTLDEAQKKYNIPDDKKEAFGNEFQELMRGEFEIPITHTIKISEEEVKAMGGISPKNLEVLSGIIEIEGEIKEEPKEEKKDEMDKG
jgi:hypothetical protein